MCVCFLIFDRWDHSTSTLSAIEDQKYSIGDEMEGVMREHKIGLAKRTRSPMQVATLVLRKIVGFLLYLGLQAVSYAAIIYLTIRASSFSDLMIASSGSAFLGASIVPAVVRQLPPTQQCRLQLAYHFLPEMFPFRRYR